MSNNVGIAALPKPAIAAFQNGICHAVALPADTAEEIQFPEGVEASCVETVVCAVRDGDQTHLGIPNINTLFPSAAAVYRNHSEAAAAWYCYEVKEQSGKLYQGYLLICSADAYGIEAALCRIDEGEEISLVSSGHREKFFHLGASLCEAASFGGGNADMVLEHLTAELSSFNNNIKLYVKSKNRMDLPAFTCLDHQFLCSQVISGMDEAIQATDRLLKKMDEVLQQYPDAGSDFPVLFADRMVSLAPIADTIRRHFSDFLSYSIDRRYSICVKEEERDLTAAYGAALLAANAVSPQAVLEDDCYLLTYQDPILLGQRGTICTKLNQKGSYAANAVYAVVGESFTVKIGKKTYSPVIPEISKYVKGMGAQFAFGLRWEDNQLCVAVKLTTLSDQAEKTIALV